MPSDQQFNQILSLTREIKSMVEAQHRDSELSGVMDKLNQISRDQEAMRSDIQDILLQLAQNQGGTAD